MKSFITIGLVLFSSLGATSAVSQEQNDFTPPKGKGIGPGRFGPWNMRLMTAVSEDGLTFKRTHQVITDQGDVPDMVVDRNGRIYLYYLGWKVGRSNNRTVLAISDDQGSSWTYKKVRLSGFKRMASPVDPDVQLLPNGTFRLYVTSDPHDGSGPRFYFAESKDGLHFTKEGVAFQLNRGVTLDPSTLRTGRSWTLFCGGGGTRKPGANWLATSSDGKSYTSKGEVSFRINGDDHAVANGIEVPGGYRLYLFSHGRTPLIRSVFSRDGVKWKPDAGIRLKIDRTSGKESHGVKDPAVVRLASGRYFMVYTTAIP